MQRSEEWSRRRGSVEERGEWKFHVEGEVGVVRGENTVELERQDLQSLEEVKWKKGNGLLHPGTGDWFYPNC
jgi:hypothetical protein